VGSAFIEIGSQDHERRIRFPAMPQANALDKFSVLAAEQAEVKALVERTRTAIVVSGAERVEPTAITSSSSLGQDSAAIAP
jgi:hypothetical protein